MDPIPIIRAHCYRSTWFISKYWALEAFVAIILDNNGNFFPRYINPNNNREIASPIKLTTSPERVYLIEYSPKNIYKLYARIVPFEIIRYVT